ncbi:hypothetical protein PRZ48_007341 [Zasmidium cellare]|uniref:histidine kinase n=1 Tax=Zasmidium cellare TaxID=395010 RepID=A0ABR0EJ31_ZASCE|nr:hypothetical protein PRZ48_007341 [Zasmidium cellare]
MLFFFDRQYTHVLAEATRTLSLQSDDTHDADDSLWLGQAIIPRGFSVCEQTLDIPASNKGSNRDHDDAGIVHVVNDLREDVRYCDRPFVVGGPKARFYAGVPITTPRGVRIGSYCVLDDKPWVNGLRPGETEFLCQMSATVMAHLETLCTRTEFGRGTQMLNGLGSFVGTSTTLRSTSTAQSDSIKSAQAATRLTSPSDETCNGSGNDRPIHTPIQDQRTSIDLSNDVSETVNINLLVQEMMGKAATIIRQAVDADGVCFLDTNPVAATQGVRYINADDEVSDAVESETSCMLGQSVFGQENASSGRLRNGLLQQILRRHSRGRLWTFDADGYNVGLQARTADRASHERPLSPGSIPHPQEGEQESEKQIDKGEADELRKHIPGARAICVVGLWDQIRERWYAGLVLWTTSPKRIFSVDGELSFLFAFCEIVMSEVARIEAKLENKAKTDLISTVSHELRSPIHGILGSVDCLKERGTLDWSTIQQIEDCGTMLRDVIEHLLDYAQINQSCEAWPPNNAMSIPSSLRKRSLAMGQETCELWNLTGTTEEICDSLSSSHHSSHTGVGKSQVGFVLETAVEPRQQCRIPIAAWKRLCTNIISNALRYTDAGHVRVFLGTDASAGQRSIRLVVQDTGCGMSPEFLQNRLFREFSQENSLREGAGLGMNIAAKIVKGLGGRVEVRSSKDSGTTVSLMIPNALVPDEGTCPVLSPFDCIQVAVLHKDQSQGDWTILSAVKTTLQSLNANLTSVDGAEVCIVLESDLQGLCKQEHDLLQSVPLIVLCNVTRHPGAREDKVSCLPNDTQRAYVVAPYGPRQLASALAANRHENGPARLTGQDEFIDAVDVPSQSQPPAALQPLRAGDTQPEQRVDMEMSQMLEITRITPAPAIDEDTLKPSTTPVVLSVCSPNDLRPTRTANPTLLLVDDNPINLRLLTTHAARQSHPHFTATNGLEAVQAYQTALASITSSTPSGIAISATKPDIILLDINMPIMDGFEAARRIRALEAKFRAVPATIVALTGLGSEEARREAQRAGMEIFVTKPLRARELGELLGRVRTLREERGWGG